MEGNITLNAKDSGRRLLLNQLELGVLTNADASERGSAGRTAAGLATAGRADLRVEVQPRE